MGSSKSSAWNISLFEALQKLLILIGKPFYYGLLLTVIGGFFFVSLLGYLLQVVIVSLIHAVLFSSHILITFLTTPSKLIKPLVTRVRYYTLRLKLKNAFAASKRIPKTKTRTRYIKRRFKKRYVLLLLVLLSPCIAVYGIWRLYLQDLPSAFELTRRPVSVSTKIYDRNNVLLYTIFEDENRSPVPLTEVPLTVRNATLAIEDADFYTHTGFSIRGIARAIIHNYQNQGELTGGSTITQQLVKNTLLSPEKTFERKIREVVLSFQVEWNFNKNQILEMYLNEVSYGGTLYGVQEASKHYFGKNVSEVNLAEAALLAGLPKSPTLYSPFGTNPEYSLGRQKEVLRLMEENGYITADEREEAENYPIVFADNRTDIKAPHFVMHTREILEQQFGKEIVDKGGLEVHTTLDLELQEMAQKIVTDEVAALTNLNVGNGAAVILDPKNGEILAMVGSTDYFDTARDGNVNVTTRLRQPGSSIKTVNYAYALSNGYTAASLIDDTPITYNIPGQRPYIPKNYDGTFKGRLTLRNAYAQSRNIPAVKVLESYGVDKMVEQGRKMGISTWEDPSRFGLSLTLGGGEVTLLDLSLVYATLANEGVRPPLTPIKKVTNYQGKLVKEAGCLQTPTNSNVGAVTSDEFMAIPTTTDCGRKVLDERVAFIMTDILKDNRARTPAFGPNSQLVIPNHPEVAVKTGTSNDLKDNLTVGYTKDYVVAVWVGNNDNQPMSRVASGLTGASTIFNKIMVELLKDTPSYTWDVPARVVQLPICASAGTLACQGCAVTQEYFLEETAPKNACNPESFRKEGEILPEAASTERN